MVVDIKLFNEKAVIPFKKHQRDFCYDCVATSCKELAPNVYEYGLGFGLQVKGYEGVTTIPAIDIRPKSGIWKTGMVLSNAPGTGDEPYTGELTVVFYHLLTNMPKYEVGDKVCQICVTFTQEVEEFNVVKEFPVTSRGDGKHGSTGVKYEYKTKEDLRKGFIEILNENFFNNSCQVSPLEITDETTFEDLGWDSLDCFMFRSDIEYRYKISIEDEELAGVTTIKQLEDIVQEKLNDKK